MKITTRIVLVTALGMQLGTVCIGQEVDRTRMLEAENRMLRATVKRQAAQIAQLKARIAELEAAAKRPTTRPAAKPAPAVKILSLSDLVAVGRKAVVPKLTKVQYEAVRNSVVGKWVSLSITVTDVKPSLLAGQVNLHGSYVSPKKLILPRAKRRPRRPRSQYEKEHAVLTVLLRARMSLDRAIKLRKGSRVVIVGRIDGFRPVGGKELPTLWLAVELDAREAPPTKGEGP